MKQVEFSPQGIRIDPDPQEQALKSLRARVEGLRSKPMPTLADLRDLLVAIIDLLELQGHGDRSS